MLQALLQSSWGRGSTWSSAAPPAWIQAAEERCGALPEAVHALLAEVNGLEAPDGAFRIFGVGPKQPRWLELAQRNGPRGWMRHYGALARDLTFFAEDAFGNQVAWDRAAERCVSFDLETGCRTPLGEAPLGWLAPVLADPERWIQLGCFEGYMEAGGALGSGEMIAYRVALALGGAPLFGNMVPRRIEVGLCLNGQIASALAAVPDGTPIEGIEWVPGG